MFQLKHRLGPLVPMGKEARKSTKKSEISEKAIPG